MGANTSSLREEQILVYEPSPFGKKKAYVSFSYKTLTIFETNQESERIVILSELIGIQEKNTSSGKEVKFLFLQSPETVTFVVPINKYDGFRKNILEILKQNESLYQKPGEKYMNL
jgi:hypothetical protein